MERNVPLKVPLCQHVMLFSDQASVSVTILPFVICSPFTFVYTNTFWAGTCSSSMLSHSRNFILERNGDAEYLWSAFKLELTSILPRKPQRTKNMHSVSTMQAPVVEHRAETDWLTAAVGMAQTRDETWWHRDVLVGFVPPTAEVSCCGTFLLESRCWKELVYKQWERQGCCAPGSLVSCGGPLQSADPPILTTSTRQGGNRLTLVHK